MGLDNDPIFDYFLELKKLTNEAGRREMTLKIMTMWANFAKTGYSTAIILYSCSKVQTLDIVI